MGFVQQIYEKMLLKKIYNFAVPQHVVLVLDESDVFSKNSINKLKHLARWCRELKIHTLTVFVSFVEENAGQQVEGVLAESMKKTLQDITGNIHIYCRGKNNETINCKDDRFRINLAIGYSGRFELTNAIKGVMSKVEKGSLDPEDINESVIEEHLCIQCEPDLVIRSGGKRLTDFLIWQSVYSEFYFTDANWQEYRKVDFLRTLRDYQKRQRRYGK